MWSSGPWTRRRTPVVTRAWSAAGSGGLPGTPTTASDGLCLGGLERLRSGPLLEDGVGQSGGRPCDGAEVDPGGVIATQSGGLPGTPITSSDALRLGRERLRSGPLLEEGAGHSGGRTCTKATVGPGGVIAMCATLAGPEVTGPDSAAAGVAAVLGERERGRGGS